MHKSKMNKRVFKLLSCILLMFASSQVSAYVLGPTTPGKWGPSTIGTGATVTWSLMGAGLATDSGTSVALSSFMPAGFKTAITAAFSAWSAVADLTFVEVVDPSVGWADPGAGVSDIRIGGHSFDGPFGTLAHGFYPPANGGTAAGDIHFDVAETWKIGFGGTGFDIFQVMAHELGHALGLNHTAVASSLMNPFYTEAYSGPQADDIAGMTYLYGPANTVSPVPEPKSVVLLLLAVILLVFGHKKNQHANLQ
ncbi:hypothetical protein NBRC116592_34360 [Colwellia sp. KU-HH00111]|uniref:matrixin family metalloprotease n=1 Tax=Colwellia sp. KU-HH00111 TaxID=3127652 RepID=UPI00310BB8B7